MIQANFRGVLVDIPTSWHEVPFSNYIKFLDAESKPIKVIEALTTLSAKDIELLNIEAVGQIQMLLSFTVEFPNAYISDEEIKKIDIGFESYGKIEVCKALLINSEKSYQVLIGICNTYLERDVGQDMTSEIYPVACFFLTKLIGSLKSTKS